MRRGRACRGHPRLHAAPPQSRGDVRVIGQSAEKPIARVILPHVATSLRKSAAASACDLTIGSKPIVLSLSCASCVFMISLMRALSVATIGAGVFAGAKKPTHDPEKKFGNPISA